jgi:hypothetical protein
MYPPPRWCVRRHAGACGNVVVRGHVVRGSWTCCSWFLDVLIVVLGHFVRGFWS